MDAKTHAAAIKSTILASQKQDVLFGFLCGMICIPLVLIALLYLAKIWNG